MLLEMQHFNFAQSQSNLSKLITFSQISLQFCPNFVSNFGQKNFARGSPDPTALVIY